MNGLAKHINKINSNLLQLLTKPITKSWLHDVRVEIKKLKALWILHPIGRGIKFGKPFSILVRLFKKAARARDYQVIRHNLQLLPAYANQKAMDKKLAQSIATETKKVSHFVKRKTNKQKMKEACSDYFLYFTIATQYLVKENKNAFQKETQKQLLEVVDKGPNAFHTLRKYLKSYGYQQHAFQKSFFHSEDGKSLYQLQNKLGKWHDWHNICHWVNGFSKKNQSISCKELLEQIAHKELHLRREAFLEIQLQAKKLPSKKQ